MLSSSTCQGPGPPPAQWTYCENVSSNICQRPGPPTVQWACEHNCDGPDMALHTEGIAVVQAAAPCPQSKAAHAAHERCFHAFAVLRRGLAVSAHVRR